MARKTDEKMRMRIRTAYVVKGYSAERCAEEFEIGARTIKEWASKEGWTDERHRISTDGAAAVQADIMEAVASDLESHRRVADRMVHVADRVLNELESLCDQIPTEFAKISKNTEGAEALKYLMARSRMLRSLVETGAKLDQWAAGSIVTGRLVRGIRDGQSSVNDTAQDAPIAEIKKTVARRPIDDTKTA